MSSKKILLAILIFAFFVFTPTFATYFSQDDWVFLSHTYKQPFSNIFKYYPEAFYRPIGQQLFFWIGTVLFGLDASGFHFLAFLIHVINILLLWKLLKSRSARFLLVTLYAVHPLHFVALNWLTQTDLEIAVLFSLLTIRFWRKTVVALPCFLAALLSHETAAVVPVFLIMHDLKVKGSSFVKSALFFIVAIFTLIAKYAANPFPFKADYAMKIDLFTSISTVKWYILRVLFLPEGVRLFPLWIQICSIVSLICIVLFFRFSLIRPLVIFSIGLAPVLFLSSHSFSVYALIPLLFFVLELDRVLRRNTSMTFMFAISFALILTSFFIIRSAYSSHWTTTRGRVSQSLMSVYASLDDQKKGQLKRQTLTPDNNYEVFFSTMKGRQFFVLDYGNGKGIFDTLFFRGNDLTTQFLPDALFFKESLLHKKFPIWNPWIFAGMPYLLDPQNFLWYPLNYLLLVLPLELGFFILLIGHLIFAGYFIKKLLTKYPIWTQWSGVFLYLFSPKLLSHLEEGNWSLVIAACWIPALYLAMKNRKNKWIIISLSALVINNLNIGYYAILFVALYFIFLKKTVLECLKNIFRILFFVVLLTLPRWLPLVLWGPLTVRANLTETVLPFWSWMKATKSLLFPLGAIYPILQNEEILYVGIIPLIFLVWKGLTSHLQNQTLRNIRNFWLVWLGFILLVSLNTKTLFYPLIRLLPGFSLLRITTRPWIFVSLLIALVTPPALSHILKKSKIIGILILLAMTGEFGIFGYKIFSRRIIPKDPLPIRFYQHIAEKTPVRAYCTTGCLDRLTAQKHGIALLGGNNPIQLTAFVRYLEQAGKYQENSYHPILPPYTVFLSKPQPDAVLLGKTSTQFIISPYKLTDNFLVQVDQEGEYRLYESKADIMSYRDHYFSLAVSK